MRSDGGFGVGDRLLFGDIKRGMYSSKEIWGGSSEESNENDSIRFWWNTGAEWLCMSNRYDNGNVSY